MTYDFAIGNNDLCSSYPCDEHQEHIAGEKEPAPVVAVKILHPLD